MKKIIVIITSLVLGSIITLAVIYGVSRNKSGVPGLEHISGVRATPAFYTLDEKGKVVPLDFTGISRKVMDAVVNIQSTQARQYADRQFPGPDDDFFRFFFGPDQIPDQRQREMNPQQQIGIGSGVIIDSNGYIVTNNHVVSGASDLEVTLHDNRTYKAEVVGTDPATDLALIRIDEKNLPVIPIANSDEAQVGEWVLAVGNPFGLTSTVTAGIISAKSRSLNINSEKNSIESYIQTDAAINPGNSGGALVNLQGGLVGINSAIASPTGSYSGYGFAVSSNIVSKVIEDLIKFGTVKRGYLGIMLRNITGKFVKDKNLKVNQGAYVDSIMPEGAARKSGIAAGDVIVAVDGKTIIQSSELQEIIAEHHPGDKVNITVNRNGDTKSFDVVLKPGTESSNTASVSNLANLESVLGAQFQPVERNLAGKLGIEGGLQVKNLRPGKLKDAHIREGFIITRVNDQPVKSPDDFKRILNNRRSNGIMMEGVYENSPEKFYYAFGM
jgi:serine protease Do